MSQTMDTNTEIDSLESSEPGGRYKQMKMLATALSEALKRVVEPVAKDHFHEDRGCKLKQVLPDKSEDYEFNSHGFEALVIPDQKRVMNIMYKENVISADNIMRSPSLFIGITDHAQEMWEDTFGVFKKHVTQPGVEPFPIQTDEIRSATDSIIELYETLVDSNPLEAVLKARRDDNYYLLADMFDTTTDEIMTPGGTDLSALALMRNPVMPYNDGEMAVIRPEIPDRGVTTPRRGLVVGHDDTPVGIFAHVVDVTNLERGQDIDHDMIRSVMGFDRELDPWTNKDELHISPNERVRIQGDLRVEKTGTSVDEFADEIGRNARIRGYRDVVGDALNDITLPSSYLRGNRSEMSVTDVFDLTVTEQGEPALDPIVSDSEVELLGYATLLRNSDTGPARKYNDYEDIPYVTDPWNVRTSMAVDTTETAIRKAREDVSKTIDAMAGGHRTTIEQEARNKAVQARDLDVSNQLNLPVDNHMAMIESGVAADVDTEPVTVAVPNSTTLTIVHGEHNTVNIEIDKGVYRFSLLPRGIQPVNTRPQW